MAAAAAAAPAAAPSAPHTPVVRWGFLSTAGIASKNFLALAGADGAACVAASSRDAGRARAWADARGIAKAYGSYEALLADGDVDAVYVPLPTTLHAEWVAKAAAAGKHVLCEKPAAVSSDELRRMLAACDAAGVQWMDGVMFMHHTRLAAMARVIRPATPGGDDTAIGALKRVTAGFTFSADAAFLAGDIRMKAALEPAGAVGDLAWYCVRFALWAFNYDAPVAAAAIAHEATPEGVPVAATGTVWFPGGRLLTFDVGFTTAFRQWAEVAGTRGTLRLDDFCIAASHDAAEFTVVTDAGLADHHTRVSERRSTVEVRGCNQERAMFENFSRLVATGTRDAFWPRVSLQTQLVCDAIMASIAAGGAKVPVAPV